jgi:hypothetical protein
MKGIEGIDVLFTIDTTGSMYPCLTQVRRNVEATVRRLFRDIPGLRVAIIVHGDYCDAGKTYVIKKIDFSSDVERICHFVRNVGPTYGGDSPECYELVLNEARALGWRAGKVKVLAMVGDDVPHEPSYPQNVKRIDWRNELKLLIEMGIHVYGIHAMPGIRRHSKWFYERIASETGGYYLTLDQFAAITDIIFAICYKQAGPEDLAAYQQEVADGHRMNRNMAEIFGTLTGRRVGMREGPSGLVPVPAGRFQVLLVDEDEAISKFVLAQGLTFKMGRGFYEFMKPEMIQEKKEVVLVDKSTGDMFSGEKARRMIGLPYGQRARVRPTDIPGYRIFVQSTSWNRKLIHGTRFLYEVEDWDRFSDIV